MYKVLQLEENEECKIGMGVELMDLGDRNGFAEILGFDQVEIKEMLDYICTQ